MMPASSAATAEATGMMLASVDSTALGPYRDACTASTSVSRNAARTAIVSAANVSLSPVRPGVLAGECQVRLRERCLSTRRPNSDSATIQYRQLPPMAPVHPTDTYDTRPISSCGLMAGWVSHSSRHATAAQNSERATCRRIDRARTSQPTSWVRPGQPASRVSKSGPARLNRRQVRQPKASARAFAAQRMSTHMTATGLRSATPLPLASRITSTATGTDATRSPWRTRAASDRGRPGVWPLPTACTASTRRKPESITAASGRVAARGRTGARHHGCWWARCAAAGPEPLALIIMSPPILDTGRHTWHSSPRHRRGDRLELIYTRSGGRGTVGRPQDHADGLRLELLGQVRAWRGDRELDLGRPKQRALLAVLLLRRDELVSRDVIVDQIWGDDPPTSAANLVHTYVSGLRKALAAENDQPLVAGGSGYRLAAGRTYLDLVAFDEAVGEARRLRAEGALTAAAEAYADALRLWRGDPLGGVSGAFVERERRNLTDRYLTAVEEAAEVRLDLGAQAELVADLSALAAAHPTRERVHLLLMLALYRSGQQAEALAVYRDLRGYHADQPLPPTEAVAGFLRALGVDARRIPRDLGERAARYRSLLASRRMLVILDNAHSSEQVVSLLPGTGSSYTLVTSRDSLAGLAARTGASRIDLDVFDVADAVALLGSRVPERVETEPEAAEALARLCAGLPLALAVAAEVARSRRTTTLHELVTELTDEKRRLDLLDAGEDPGTAVRAVFSWSYRHLDAAAARLFRLGGLHPGPDLDVIALAALAGTGDREAAAYADVLVRAHLWVEISTRRFGMHDLLRLYAREQAEVGEPADERDLAIRRLLLWYLNTAAAAEKHFTGKRRDRELEQPAGGPPPLRFADQSEAMQWCENERANLVAAAALAYDRGDLAIAWQLPTVLGVFFYLRKYWTDWLATHRTA